MPSNRYGKRKYTVPLHELSDLDDFDFISYQASGNKWRVHIPATKNHPKGLSAEAATHDEAILERNDLIVKSQLLGKNRRVGGFVKDFIEDIITVVHRMMPREDFPYTSKDLNPRKHLADFFDGLWVETLDCAGRSASSTHRVKCLLARMSDTCPPNRFPVVLYRPRRTEVFLAWLDPYGHLMLSPDIPSILPILSERNRK